MFICCWQAYRWEQPPPLSLAKPCPNPAYTKERPPLTKTQVFSWIHFRLCPTISYAALQSKTVTGWKLFGVVTHDKVSFGFECYIIEKSRTLVSYKGEDLTCDVNDMITKSRAHTMMILYDFYDNMCLHLHLCVCVCVFHQRDQDFFPCLAWPLSLILCRIIFLFLWEHCMPFLSQLKSEHPHLNNQNVWVRMDMQCNHVPSFRLGQTPSNGRWHSRSVSHKKIICFKNARRSSVDLRLCTVYSPVFFLFFLFFFTPSLWIPQLCFIIRGISAACYCRKTILCLCVKSGYGG